MATESVSNTNEVASDEVSSEVSSEENEESKLRTQTCEVLRKNIPRFSSKQIEELEEHIHNHCENNDIYIQTVIKVITNLKSEYVVKNIEKGEWSLDEFIKLERESLNPTKWQQLQEARLPKNVKKERVKGTNKCPRCKSWYTTYKQAQTRSGDEGLTTRCHCEDCDYHWKFG